MVAQGLFAFYRFWHGTLHWRGAGRLLVWAARYNRGLQAFRLAIPSIGEAAFDFRDGSTFYWVNYLLGDRPQEQGLDFVIRRFLKPGSIFWDVGANVGLISGLVLADCPDVKIVAIEPNPLLAPRLKLLFSAHQRVTVLQRGLSDRDGESPFFIPDGASSVGTLQIGASRRGKVVQVRLSRGDSLLDELTGLTAPALIKIDVEGHEAEVLRGLSHIISQHRPVIIFEHLFLTDETVQQLAPVGYVRFSIHDKTGQLLPGVQRHDSHNTLLLPVERDGQ